MCEACHAKPTCGGWGMYVDTGLHSLACCVTHVQSLPRQSHAVPEAHTAPLAGRSWPDGHGRTVVAGWSWRAGRGRLVVAGWSWRAGRGRLVVAG
eukprot:287136-Chlamydomonas_euryale.AAC.1